MKTTTLKLLPALLLCTAFAACNKPETPAETQADVMKEQAEGVKEVSEATQKMAEEHTENVTDAAKNGEPLSKGDMKEDVNNLHKVEMEQAEAAYSMAKEKCDAFTGEAKDSCQSAAKATYETAKTAADAKKDMSKDQIKAQ